MLQFLVVVFFNNVLLAESTRMCERAGCATFSTIHIRSHKVAPVTHRTRDPMIYVYEYILPIFFVVLVVVVVVSAM